MRENIGLYRGKRNDNGEWVYWNIYGELTAENGKRKKYTITKGAKTRCYYYIYQLKQTIIPETVGEYTGLTDKNGKKIFEGDIFKFPDEVWESCYTSCGTEYDSWEVENYGVIGFAEYSAKYDFVKYKYNENSVEADLHENGTLDFVEFLAELEIVGNIHDNSELLN